MFGLPSLPATEAMETMRPYLFSRMCPMTALQPFQTPSMLTRMHLVQSL